MVTANKGITPGLLLRFGLVEPLKATKRLLTGGPKHGTEWRPLEKKEYSVAWRKYMSGCEEAVVAHRPYWVLQKFIGDYESVKTLCELNGQEYKASAGGNAALFHKSTRMVENFEVE
jgi:hypothetical protein